jgi:hypothetical protein
LSHLLFLSTFNVIQSWADHDGSEGGQSAAPIFAGRVNIADELHQPLEMTLLVVVESQVAPL